MSEHPSKVDIEAWTNGTLEESKIEALETHLESCASCESVLEEVLAQKSTAQEDTKIPNVLPEYSGKLIGRYKLLQLIGEGGMGSVWMADQLEPVRRNVALKIIKAGMDTKEVIARFEVERQALALMDHPNIARVLDGGVTDNGRPYFVMELVKGIPFIEFCDQAKLSTERRLELFCDLCHAVQHAHRKGIIHRDIKPSNVLVATEDGIPVLKIIDFGLAKATGNKLTEKTLFTAVGQMLGTPAYMSPEQAKMTGLDIDTRTDVYSLGVLLYELLTGITPLDMQKSDDSSLPEMQRIIVEDDPPTPSSSLSSVSVDSNEIAEKRNVEPAVLMQKLRGDLDVIVMKAMEKDRNRRYETPRDFADDIQCYLNQQPIRARPATKWYRFKRAYTRNRLAFIASGLIASSVLIGFAVSTYLAIKATRAEARANDALQTANEERDHAIASEKLAESRRQESEAARQQAESVTRTLTNVLASPDPRREGNSITVAEMLDSAVKTCQQDLNDQPELQNQLLTAIAKSYSALQIHLRALPVWEQVFRYNKRALGADADETLMAQKNLADSCLYTLDNDRAKKILHDLITTANEKHGAEHEMTVAARNSLIKTVYAEQPVEAISQWEQLGEHARQSLGPRHPETLDIQDYLCSGYHRIGDLKKSIAARRNMIGIYRELYGDTHPDTLASQSGLILSYLARGDYEEALPLASEHLEACKSSLGEFHRTSLRATDRMAAVMEGLEKHDDAITIRERAVDLRKRMLGNEPFKLRITLRNLVRAYSIGGQTDKALQLGRDLVESVKAEYGKEDEKTIETSNSVALALVTVPVEDKQTVDFAVELAKKVTAARGDNAAYFTTLALASYRNRDWAAADMAIRKAIDLSESASPQLLALDAMIRWQNQNADQARQKLQQARTAMDQNQSQRRNDLDIRLVDEASQLIKPAPEAEAD